MGKKESKHGWNGKLNIFEQPSTPVTTRYIVHRYNPFCIVLYWLCICRCHLESREKKRLDTMLTFKINYYLYNYLYNYRFLTLFFLQSLFYYWCQKMYLAPIPVGDPHLRKAFNDFYWTWKAFYGANGWKQRTLLLNKVHSRIQVGEPRYSSRYTFRLVELSLALERVTVQSPMGQQLWKPVWGADSLLGGGMQDWLKGEEMWRHSPSPALVLVNWSIDVIIWLKPSVVNWNPGATIWLCIYRYQLERRDKKAWHYVHLYILNK